MSSSSAANTYFINQFRFEPIEIYTIICFEQIITNEALSNV